MLKKTRTILRLLPWGLGEGQLMRTLIVLGLGALIIAALLPSISAHNGEPQSQANAAAQSCSSGAGVSSAVAQVQPDEEACRVESPQSQANAAAQSCSAGGGISSAVGEVKLGEEAWQAELPQSVVNNDVVKVTAADTVGQDFGTTAAAGRNSGSGTSTVSYSSLTKALVMSGKAILAINGDIALSGNSRVTSSTDSGVGGIHANGNVSLSGCSMVRGNVSATGQVVKKGFANVTGSIMGSTNKLDFTRIDTSVYLREADGGLLWNGNYIIKGADRCSPPFLLGPIHITGDLIISGRATVVLMGTVYVDGMIRMSGSTCIQGSEIIVAEGGIVVAANGRLPNPGSIPLMISVHGDISVAGDGWMSAALYAPDGEVRLAGNAKVYGCVVGKSVRESGNSEVRYSFV